MRVHHVDYIHRGHDIGDVAMYLQACWLVAGCLADHDRPDQIAHDRHQPALGVLIGNPFGLPTEWQWSNYGNIIVSQRYWLQMSNSLVIAMLTVFLTLAFGAMAAFCFAIYRNEFNTEWQLGLAFITLTILPTIIVFSWPRNTSSPVLPPVR
ncbi:hypothetical protein SAMN03159496_00721 [Rhizobium sp. NFR07]|nr:hypothetical protein SAMN03159496_00721 [Rhizobium sp. NFR07]